MCIGEFERHNSTGKLRVYKIEVNGNQVKKKEIRHQEFLAKVMNSPQVKQNQTHFKNQKLSDVVTDKIDINAAIKSLSPKGRNLEVVTKNLNSNLDYFNSFKGNSGQPIQMMDPSTATLRGSSSTKLKK